MDDKIVYAVIHATNKNCDNDVFMIGVFDTEARARQAVEKYYDDFDVPEAKRELWYVMIVPMFVNQYNGDRSIFQWGYTSDYN